ncbi:hypothetical protein [Cochlodiniinecator piscidefendens]|uniref:hypothetical protein n=1 Tax=Cochlodiniinecator piscidefendens TaxID=2715756 RepID=UPI001409020C|nr:hypothetical protein [Cochlodiniinecator piscidefendens]
MKKEFNITEQELEKLLLETDDIIEVGAGFYQTFSEEYLGKNSGKSNLSSKELAENFEARKASYMDSLGRLMQRRLAV